MFVISMIELNSSLNLVVESLVMNMWWWIHFIQKNSGNEFDYFSGGSGFIIIKKQGWSSCQKQRVYNIWLQVLTSCRTL